MIFMGTWAHAMYIHSTIFMFCVHYAHYEYGVPPVPMFTTKLMAIAGSRHDVLCIFYSPRPTPERRCEALVQAMAEILWRAGNST